jgi:hypothetical protein
MNLKKLPRSVVKISKTGSRGVLVGGNMMLTAAHCINYTTNGPYFIEEIETGAGLG